MSWHVKQGTRVLVISDYRMPQVGGVEFLRAVRKKHSSAQVRFVLLSSIEQAADSSEALKEGADAFRVKPASLDAFRALLDSTVNEWLSSLDAAGRGGNR